MGTPQCIIRIQYQQGGWTISPGGILAGAPCLDEFTRQTRLGGNNAKLNRHTPADLLEEIAKTGSGLPPVDQYTAGRILQPYLLGGPWRVHLRQLIQSSARGNVNCQPAQQCPLRIECSTETATLSEEDLPPGGTAHQLTSIPWELAELDGTPLCQRQELLMYRGYSRQGSPNRLSPDSGVRALVVVNGPDQEISSDQMLDRISKSDTARLEQMKSGVKLPCTALADYKLEVLSRERSTWTNVRDQIAKGEWNTIVYVGHIQDAMQPGGGLLTFWGGENISPAQWCEALRGALHLKCVVIAGCNTVRHFAMPVLSSTSASVFVGSNFLIRARDHIVAVERFVATLLTTGRTDHAFVEMRDALEPQHRCTPSMHVVGDSFSLVSNDPFLIRKIRHARSLITRFELLDLPGMEADAETSDCRPRDACCISRQVQHQVPQVEPPAAKKRDTAMKPSTAEQRRSMTKVSQGEEWLLQQLVLPSNMPCTLGITGGSGVGKSTLVQTLCRKAALRFLADPDQGLLPLFIGLRHQCSSPALLVQMELSRAELPADTPPENLLLFFDGLDEASISNSSEWGRDFRSKRWERCRSVISSRPEATARFALPHFSERSGSRQHILALSPLSLRQVRTFVEQFFRHSGRIGEPHARTRQAKRVLHLIDRSRALESVANEPFMLSLLCMIYEIEPEPTIPPETPTDLLKLAVNLLIRRRNVGSHGTRGQLADEHIVLLAAIAFAETRKLADARIDEVLMASPTVEAPLTIDEACTAIEQIIDSDVRLKDDLRRRYQSPLDDSPHVLMPTARDLLDQLVNRSGLLGRQRETVGILDVRIREFLAGFHLFQLCRRFGWDDEPCLKPRASRKRSRRTTALDKLNPRWTVAGFVSRYAWLNEELGASIQHLASLMDNPAPLLAELSRKTPSRHNPHGDTKLRHRLTLACRCIGSIGSGRVKRSRNCDSSLAREVDAVAARAWRVVPLPVVVHPVPKQLGHLLFAGAHIRRQTIGGYLLGEMRLRASDIEGQQRALRACVRAMGLAEALTPALLGEVTSILESSDTVYLNASYLILHYYIESGRAVPSDIINRLVDLLKQHDRQYAVSVVLSKCRGGFPPAVYSTLLTLLDHPSDKVRAAAARAMERSGESIPDQTKSRLADLLGDPNADVRSAAARALQGIGSRIPSAACNKIAAFWNHSDPDVRVASVSVLEFTMAWIIPQLQPGLLKLLQDSSENVRAAATRVLQSSGLALKEDLQLALVSLVAHDDNDVRTTAANLLNHAGPFMPLPVVRRLSELLYHEDGGVVEQASTALEHAGHQLSVPILQRLAHLACGIRFRNSAPLRVLEQLGPATPPEAMAAVLSALKSEISVLHTETASAACTLLAAGANMPPAYAELLIEQAGVSTRAIYSQARAGTKSFLESVRRDGGKIQHPILRGMTRNEISRALSLRDAALQILCGAWDSLSPPFLAKIEKLILTRYVPAEFRSSVSLIEIGTMVLKKEVKQIELLLHHNEKWIRTLVVDLLANVEAGLPPSLVPALAKMLTTGFCGERTRSKVSEMLIEIGNFPRSVIKELISALDSWSIFGTGTSASAKRVLIVAGQRYPHRVVPLLLDVIAKDNGSLSSWPVREVLEALLPAMPLGLVRSVKESSLLGMVHQGVEERLAQLLVEQAISSVFADTVACQQSSTHVTTHRPN